MRTETTTRNLYTYAELSDKAKERARDWYREACAGDNYFAEHVTDEFHETLKAFGFDVDTLPVTLMSGKTRRDPCIYWSGFSSQGDGAAFAGTWRAADFAPDALLANRPAGTGKEYASNNELHRVAGELRACIADGLTFARIETRGRGFHMALESYEYAEGSEENDTSDAERFLEAARDMAHQFYRDLEAEYEYQNSDDAVAEAIEANEYEFTEEGERA